MWVAALAPACIVLFMATRYRWAGPTLVALAVVVAIVAAFIIIEAFGLCSTFGQLVPA